jgi:hypothetical protein
MRHTPGCGAVVGVVLATLWLCLWFSLTRLGIGPVLEDGSGTIYWDGKPVSSYCLPLAICN